MNATKPTSTDIPPFTRPSNAARDGELLVEGRFQIVPDAQARGLCVRERYIAFHALGVVIDHDVDHVARLDGYFAGRSHELLDGNDAFGFVSEIDDYIFGVTLRTRPCSSSSSAGGTK